MPETLPGITTLETVGASLLALQRQLNLAPAPGLALTGDAWQVFANPLERLGALTPPLPGAAAASEEAAPAAPAYSPPGASTAQAAAWPVRLNPSQPQPVSQAQSASPVWNTSPIQPSSTAGPTPLPPAGSGPAGLRAGADMPAGSDSQPRAGRPAGLSGLNPGVRPAAASGAAGPGASLSALAADFLALAAGPTGAAPELAAAQPARLSPQAVAAPAQVPLPPLGSETRLVSKASGLAALLQANLQPVQPVPDQIGLPAPLVRLAPPASPDSVPLSSVPPSLRPAEWDFQAAEREFAPFPPAVEPAANPPGFDQTLPQPGSEPEAFQTWLDELELAYLRMYGTSGI